MKTKLLGLVLAATMLCGATMTVFADNAPVSGQLTYEGEVTEITITVTLTEETDTKVILNPYCLLVDDVSSSLKVTPITFKNSTGVPVSLGLKGAVDVSGNEIDVLPALIRPATPAAKKQVNVNVSYENADGAKMISTATAKVADAAVPYEKGTLETAKALKVSPVMAAGDDNSAVKDSKGAAIDGVTYSDSITLSFGGWCLPKLGEQWPSDAAIKVITIYDLKPEDLSKRSMFKTIS